MDERLSEQRVTTAVQNTDRELWREREGDYYADSVHVTATGLLGINVGGTVWCKRLKDWVACAKQSAVRQTGDSQPLDSGLDVQIDEGLTGNQVRCSAEVYAALFQFMQLPKPNPLAGAGEGGSTWKTPENTPCEWYGKQVGPHSLVDIYGGGKRCQNCKHEFLIPVASSPVEGAPVDRLGIYAGIPLSAAASLAQGALDPPPAKAPDKHPEKSDNWMLMIDEVCCEYGPPEYRMTEDGEAWYWCFPGHDLPVADNLSELLVAGAQLTAIKRVKANDESEAE